MGSHFVKTGLGNDVASAQYFDTPQQAFSQANQNLQASNYALPSFLAQKTDATITPGDPANPESAPSIQGGNLAPSFLSQPVNLPKIQTPSFLQAQNSPQLAQKSETKMGKLFQILQGAAEGAGAGAGQRTFGGGFQAAQESGIQRQQARQAQQEADLHQQQGQQQLQLGNAEIQMLPLKYQAAGLGLQKTQSDILANETKSALEAAQSSAAKYKEVNGQLFDISGDKPVAAQGVGQMVPADEKVAKLASIPVGTPLPLDTYTKLNTAANSGVQSVQANGRSLLVDKQGNTVKDLGASTPVVTMNMQMNGGTATGGATTPGGPASFYSKLAPARQGVVDQIGQGKEDMATALAPYRRFPGVAEQMQAALREKYPDWKQSDFGVTKKLEESFSSGDYSKNLNAIDTARQHMKLFRTLADKLENGNSQAWNQLGNAIGVQFGKDQVTNFNIARQFFSGEVGKAVVNGGGTGSERDQLADSINTASSPNQLSGAFSVSDGLLAGKQQALKDTYNSWSKDHKPNFGSEGGSTGKNKHSDIGFVKD